MQQENFNDVNSDIKDIMIGLVEFLNHHGIETVPCGAVMRLLGVPNQDAELWDQHYLILIDDILDVQLLDENSGQLVQDEKLKPTLH